MSNLDVELVATWRNIREANASFVEPVDVLRLINAVSPRNWCLELTFADSTTNHLRVRASPTLDRAELLRLVDGRLAALFSCKQLCVHFEGAYLCLDLQTPDDARPSPIRALFEPAALPHAPAQLHLIGAPHIQQLHQANRLRDWLYRHTWLGSQRFAARRHTVVVDVFGARSEIAPHGRAAGSSEEPLQFSSKRTLMVGGAPLGDLSVTCAGRGAHVIRHAYFGEFDPEHFINDFWKQCRISRSCSLSIEFDDNDLSWWSALGPQDSHRVRTILRSIIDALADLDRSVSFTDFLESLNTWRRMRAAQQLAARQRTLEQRRRVRVQGREIFAEPTCENELVSLYMKLEASGNLPFDCQVIEYTSKVGIDALGHFRFSADAMWTRNAPIEFEYMLANYFDHEHPPQQTALIICWDIEDEQATTAFDRVRQQWLRQVAVDQHTIPVVVISRIPSLICS